LSPIAEPSNQKFRASIMIKRYLIIVSLFLLSVPGYSQSTTDTVPVSTIGTPDVDTTFDYDELMDELDLFLDSLLRPKSFFLVNFSLGSNYFNYWRRNLTQLESTKRGIFSTILGYYHKSGLGLTVSGNVTDDEEKLNLYQFSISPSFDYIQNLDWTAGIAYTRYITKDSLNFYTSPLQNELNAYFTWRKSWIQPGIAVSYGSGSRTEYKERKKFVEFLRRRRGQIVNIYNTDETVADFLVTGFVRHSFYWMHVINNKDHIKLTPQLSFSAGSQQYGFNSTNGIYSVNRRNAATLLYSTGDISVDDKMEFQPISVTMHLRPEYSIGKIFIQPQFILDYYFPSETLTPLFYLNAGIIF
jgi:hypothetical protein